MTIPKLLTWNIKSKLRKSGTPVPETAHVNVEGDVNAAIAMALHCILMNCMMKKATSSPLKNATKQYSPWSSKIYGVQNQPVKK